MSNSEGVIFHSTDEDDDPVSGAAKQNADDLVPIISNANFQSDVLRLIIGIFASHFQTVRANVARALHERDLMHQSLVADLTAREGRIAELETTIRSLKRELRRPDPKED